MNIKRDYDKDRLRIVRESLSFGKLGGKKINISGFLLRDDGENLPRIIGDIPIATRYHYSNRSAMSVVNDVCAELLSNYLKSLLLSPIDEYWNLTSKWLLSEWIRNSCHLSFHTNGIKYHIAYFIEFRKEENFTCIFHSFVYERGKEGTVKEHGETELIINYDIHHRELSISLDLLNETDQNSFLEDVSNSLRESLT